MDALRGKKKTEQNLSRNSTWASSNYMRERGIQITFKGRRKAELLDISLKAALIKQRKLGDSAGDHHIKAVENYHYLTTMQ